VRYSRSYGPGRYDPQYEWAGRDYPIGHVRWTENRNFEACLQLMNTGALDLKPVTSRRATFADAVAVYQDLLQPGNTDIGLVLEYGGTGVSPVLFDAAGTLPAAIAKEGQTPVLHVIGAGNFARTMLLPHLRSHLPFGVVVNATGLSARHVKEKFAFASASADPGEVFAEAHTREAVVIATRHHLHGPMVIQALKQHQQVFVEKPLCLSLQELVQIDQAQAASQGSVMVGFNRRFAPATVALRSMLKDLPGPKTLSYHVFAGPLAPDHWYANLEESGGRILGEGCHFLDFACHVLGESPVCVSAQAQGADSFMVQVEFSGGSSFQLVYSAEGDFSFPKETFRIFASGTVIECENFVKVTQFQNRKSTVKKFQSKGHAEEMAAWLAYLRGSSGHPLPYAEARSSMRLTFSVLQAIRERRLVEILGPQSNPWVDSEASHDSE
jgi:predicted dehydrogenase